MTEAPSAVLFFLSLGCMGLLALILLILLGYSLIDRQENPRRVRTVSKILIFQLLFCSCPILFFKLGMYQQDYEETLCIMVSNRDFPWVRQRLLDGQDVNSCFTERSQSALDLAIENKDAKMIALLKKYGARQNLPDYNYPR